MSDFQHNFDDAVWKIVSKIPSGNIMSYGGIARAAGYPRHARMVSKAMSRANIPLPWYRVVRSDRSLAFKSDSAAYQKQKEFLRREGVAINNGKLPAKAMLLPEQFQLLNKNKSVKNTINGLDKMLWGTPPVEE